MLLSLHGDEAGQKLTNGFKSNHLVLGNYCSTVLSTENVNKFVKVKLVNLQKNFIF